MKHTFENLLRELGKDTTLTNAEREKMRFVLREYISLKPLPTPGMPSLFREVTVFSTLMASLRRPAFATVAIVAVFALTSGSVAYAAEGALPGDALYGIKTGVNEPARAFLAVSPEAKAAVHVALAERRIDEAAALLKENRLNTDTEDALAADFTAHAMLAESSSNETDASDSDIKAVATTNFKARLAAYEHVIAEVKSTHKKGSSLALQTAIRTEITNLEAPPAAPRAFAATSLKTMAVTSPVRDLTHLKIAADEALQASAELLGSAEETLDASTSQKARAELQYAQSLSTRGKRFLKENDTDRASAAFKASLSATARLDVLTHAAATLKINAFATTTASSTPSDDSENDSNENDDGFPIEIPHPSTPHFPGAE